MTDGADHGLLLLLFGAVVLVSVPLRQGLARLALPGLVGFVALGIALAAVERATGLPDSSILDQVGFLAQLGIVALLFRVGLESDPERLLGQVRRAVAIWLPDTLLAGLAAFALVL